MRRGELMLRMQHSNATRKWPPFDPTPPAKLTPQEADCWNEILALVPIPLVAFDGLALEIAAMGLALHRRTVAWLGPRMTPDLRRLSWRGELWQLQGLCIAPEDRRLLLTGKRTRA